MSKFNLQKDTTLSTTLGTGSWVSASDLADEGVILTGDLVTARPVGTLIYNGGELYVSTDADVATYTQITNTGGIVSTGIVLIETNGTQTFYNTIGDALAAASSGEVVLLYPGTYNESVTIPSGVRLVGFPAAQNVTIAGADATSTRVTMADTSTLREVTVTGPTSGSNPAIMSTVDALELAVLFNVVLIGGGGSGAMLQHTGAGQLVLLDVYHNGGTLTGPFISASAGSVTFNNLLCNAGTATTMLELSGNVRCIGNSMIVGAPTTYTNLISMDDTAFMDISVLTINGQATLTNGLHVLADGVDINMRACEIEADTWDILVASGLTGSGTQMQLDGCEFRLEKVSAPAAWFQGLTVGAATFFDVGISDDTAFRIGSELAVGIAARPSEAAFGTGDSSTLNMRVLSDDGTGTAFVDNTAAAKSSSGSTFSLWQATTAGHVAYMGYQADAAGAAIAFTNVKVDGGGTAINLGAGAIIWEYWSGAAWSELHVLATDADSPYTQKAQGVFAITTTNDQIRFGVPGDWAQNAVNSITGYWIRCRITTGITTVPVLERMKLGSNRTEINKDGFIEFFGDAEPIRPLLVHQRLTDDLQGASPSNANVDISTNINLTPLDNSFANSTTDGFAEIIRVPNGLDTSRNLTYSVYWKPSNTNTGNVDLRFYVSIVEVGDALTGGLTEVEYTADATVTAPGVTDQLVKSDFTFSIQDATPAMFLATALKRYGSDASDTFTGALEVVAIELNGTFWR